MKEESFNLVKNLAEKISNALKEGKEVIAVDPNGNTISVHSKVLLFNYDSVLFNGYIYDGIIVDDGYYYFMNGKYKSRFYFRFFVQSTIKTQI